MLFHYTGTPNTLTSGRNVPYEVMKRLRRSGFVAELSLDGVLATKNWVLPRGRNASIFGVATAMNEISL